jgi:hypothetical protein
MNFSFRSCHLFKGLLLVFLAVNAPGQEIPFSQTAGVNSILPHLLGSLRGFSSEAHVVMKQKDLTNQMEMTMELMYLQGKMRAEINMNRVKTADLRPQMIAGLREIGMDRVITITDPNAEHTLIIYPNLKAYIHAPPLQKDQPEVQVEKNKLGEKVMEGHLCHHYEVTLTPPLNARNPQKIQTWEAVDLGNFPLQIKISQKTSDVTVLFINPNLDLPEISSFQPPSNFTQYPTMEKVMENAVQKLLESPVSTTPAKE